MCIHIYTWTPAACGRGITIIRRRRTGILIIITIIIGIVKIIILDLCVSSLRRGRANFLCIVPILTDDPQRESKFVVHIISVTYFHICLEELWKHLSLK